MKQLYYFHFLLNLLLFLFKYLAILCDGSCVLFIAGLIGAFSLCVLTYALSCGALGFMLVIYLCVLFSINSLHCCIAR